MRTQNPAQPAVPLPSCAWCCRRQKACRSDGDAHRPAPVPALAFLSDLRRPLCSLVQSGCACRRLLRGARTGSSLPARGAQAALRGGPARSVTASRSRTWAWLPLWTGRAAPAPGGTPQPCAAGTASAGNVGGEGGGRSAGPAGPEHACAHGAGVRAARGARTHRGRQVVGTARRAASIGETGRKVRKLLFRAPPPRLRLRVRPARRRPAAQCAEHCGVCPVPAAGVSRSAPVFCFLEYFGNRDPPPPKT